MIWVHKGADDMSKSLNQYGKPSYFFDEIVREIQSHVSEFQTDSERRGRIVLKDYLAQKFTVAFCKAQDDATLELLTELYKSIIEVSKSKENFSANDWESER